MFAASVTNWVVFGIGLVLVLSYMGVINLQAIFKKTKTDAAAGADLRTIIADIVQEIITPHNSAADRIDNLPSVPTVEVAAMPTTREAVLGDNIVALQHYIAEQQDTAVAQAGLQALALVSQIVRGEYKPPAMSTSTKQTV